MIKPREWQIEALSIWRSNSFRGVVSVVTGGGKSIFGLLCAKELFELKKVSKVLIVVPTLTLQDQWVVNVVDYFGESIDDISVWRSDSYSHRKFNVVVVNSLSRIPPFFVNDLLIIADECHRYGGDTFFKAINRDWVYSIGLSATPQREYDSYFDDRIAPVLGQVLYTYSYNQALLDNVINSYRLINVLCPLNRTEQLEYTEISKSLGAALRNGNIERSKILAIKRSRVSNQAESRLKGALGALKICKNRPTIFFFETISFAKRFTSILDRLRIGHVMYFSGMSEKLRQNNLYAFKKGYFNILVACKALDEGLDIPSIENAVIVSSSSTKRQRIQRLGRALRITQRKGVSTIITLYSIKDEEFRLIEEVADLPSDVQIEWMSIDV